jgi:hypothetical protein
MPIQCLVLIQTNSEMRSAKYTGHFEKAGYFFKVADWPNSVLRLGNPVVLKGTFFVRESPRGRHRNFLVSTHLPQKKREQFNRWLESWGRAERLRRFITVIRAEITIGVGREAVEISRVD